MLCFVQLCFFTYCFPSAWEFVLSFVWFLKILVIKTWVRSPRAWMMEGPRGALPPPPHSTLLMLDVFLLCTDYVGMVPAERWPQRW